MSDVMFYGVLRMPFDMAMADEISRIQFYGRAQEAADRVERLEAELAARRSPADASGAVELPPLPKDEFCSWAKNGQVFNAFPYGVGDKAKWDHDGYWSSKGWDRAPLYTAEQVRQAQREAVAADRWGRANSSKNSSSCSQQSAPAASIDTEEFRTLLIDVCEAYSGGRSGLSVRKLGHTLIAHIDANMAEARRVPDGFVLVPAEPTEAMVHAGEDVPPPRQFGKVWRAMLAAAGNDQQKDST